MKGEQMSLLHEFVAVRQPTNKKILYSENIYEYTTLQLFHKKISYRTF